jgi:hypothetical protein
MSIQIDNSTAGKLLFYLPVGGVASLKFPTGQGGNGTALKTNGAGQLSWGTGTPLAITMGLDTSATNATTNVSYLIASTVSAQNGISVAGTNGQTGGVLTSIPDSTVTGGNARTGTTPTELTLKLLARSDATWVVQGTQNTAISPINSKIDGTYNVVLGGYAQILGSTTNSYTQIGGDGNSSGYHSINNSPQYLAIFGGRQINTDKAGSFNVVLNGDGSRDGNGSYSTVSGWNYYTHWARRTCMIETTNATQTVMTPLGTAESSTGANLIPVDTSGGGQQICMFDVRVVAATRGTFTGSANTGKAWRVTGAMKMGTTSASTVLIGTPTITVIGQDATASTWAIAVTAGTTLASVQIKATGQAAVNIRWVAFFDILNGSTQ